MTPEQEQEYREEAQRLAMLPVDEQKQILALYRECASNPKVPKRERVWGLVRVKALERHLRRLNRAGKSRRN